MAIELVCSCGRLVRFDKPPAGGQARCPDCNAVLTIDNDRSIKATITDVAISDDSSDESGGHDSAGQSQRPPRPPASRKPLWELMGRGQTQSPPGQLPGQLPSQLPGQSPGEPSGDARAAAPTEPPGAVTIEAGHEADAESTPAAPAAEPAAPGGGRKGLWSVMQTPAVTGARERPIVTSPDKNPVGPILTESVPTPGSPSSKSEIPIPKSEISIPPSPASPSISPPDSLAALIDIAANDGLLSAQSKAAGFKAGNSRRAFTAALLGGLSIPLSGLALINAGWSRVPATALGFVAVLTGLIASQEIQRSGGRKTGRRQAISGIVTGIIGSFLGPLVIAPLSKLRKGR